MKKLLGLILLVGVFAASAIPDVPDKTAEFTFARVQFNMNWDALFDREAPWHHDYPYSENFYLGILQELTSVRTSNEAYQIVQLDSRDIFQFPFLYVSEPGFMELTEPETANLREYFNRGGFVMFDDFRARDLANLQFQMKKVFPGREMFRLDAAHPIFNTFFSLDSIEMMPPYYDNRFEGRGAEFWGMTDEEGHLILIANLNNDFGEYWEWVDRAEMPFEPAALSVRFGVNYLIYAMSH